MSRLGGVALTPHGRTDRVIPIYPQTLFNYFAPKIYIDANLTTYQIS